MIEPRHYIESAPVPLAIVRDAREQVRFANRAFAEALDTAYDALFDRPLADLFADPNAVDRRLREVRSGQVASAAAPLTNARGNSVLFTAWRINDPERDEVGVLLAAGRAAEEGSTEEALKRTLRDVNEALLITALEEQAHAEEARSESEAKSVFLASVSHELRTPLNSILGYSDLLDAGVPEELPEALRSHVERIRSAAQHLLSLIEQIIEASRAEFDERVNAERFDIAAFLPEVVDLVRSRAKAAGLELRLERSVDSLEVVSDRRKIRQILLNLVVNAIKFTEDGEVRAVLDHTDETFILRVTDTGVGMSQEEQAHVFRRFWQVGSSSVRTEGGMGIGLWVVRTLVDAMDGEITLESAPGEGSTFTVELPRMSSPTEPSGAGAEPPHAASEELDSVPSE